jgi:hypothetical protein
VVPRHPLMRLDADLSLLRLDGKILTDRASPVSDEGMGRFQRGILRKEVGEEVVERFLTLERRKNVVRTFAS